MNGGRTLTTGVQPDGSTSIETCTDACFNAGYPLAGTEFADECYCGLDFSNGGAQVDLTDCTMVCAGNSTEFCGGPNRLNVCCRSVGREKARSFSPFLAGLQFHGHSPARSHSTSATWRRRSRKPQCIPCLVWPSGALELQRMLGVRPTAYVARHC